MSRSPIFAALLAVAALISACGNSKLTPANYAKLEVGMDYGQVTTLLGTPSSCDDILGAKRCTWGDDKRYIQIHFIANKTAAYQARNIQ